VSRPPTSTAAHRRSLHAAPRDRGRILDLLRMHPEGLTCWEVEQKLGLLHQTCSARFDDLSKAGQIGRTLRTRPTGSGSPATVYRLAAHLAGACPHCLGKGCLMCERER
jgi:predicted ArsR family transcriptional regulator